MLDTTFSQEPAAKMAAGERKVKVMTKAE